MMKYIVLAYFFDQPPIETQARQWKKLKQFDKTATLQDIDNWIKSLPDNHCLNEIELIIEEE